VTPLPRQISFAQASALFRAGAWAPDTLVWFKQAGPKWNRLSAHPALIDALRASALPASPPQHPPADAAAAQPAAALGAPAPAAAGPRAGAEPPREAAVPGTDPHRSDGASPRAPGLARLHEQKCPRPHHPTRALRRCRCASAARRLRPQRRTPPRADEQPHARDGASAGGAVGVAMRLAMLAVEARRPAYPRARRRTHPRGPPARPRPSLRGFRTLGGRRR
jgi:hypothetical protein